MSDDARGPGVGTVVLLSFLISLLVSGGVHLGLREVLPPKAPAAATAPTAAENVDVPSLMGVDVAQARGLLDPKGLLLSLDGEREDPAPAGSIITQSPLAGSRVQRGATVHATVSRGQARVRVPEVAGQSAEAAAKALSAAGLVAVPAEPEVSASVPAGTVISTAPPAGAEVARGAEVKLRVSAGAGAVEVPKVTGMQLGKAKELLERAKLVLTTRPVPDEEHYPGFVLKQEPAPGTKVAAGSAVTLQVSAEE